MESIFSKRLGFDEWVNLASSDPDAFEQLRTEILNEIIDRAPTAAQRHRLRGLQWRIDMVRKQSKTPLAACIRMYNMMWDKVLGDNGMLAMIQTVRPEELPELVSPVLQDPDDPVSPESAQIVRFPSSPDKTD